MCFRISKFYSFLGMSKIRFISIIVGIIYKVMHIHVHEKSPVSVVSICVFNSVKHIANIPLK